MSLKDRGMLIIEGIHCLNEEFSAEIPADRKMKVYASCLAQVNLCEHTRISTTDIRLMRRIIRDNRTRGYSPSDTIEKWPAVVQGERSNIFPYQENADVIINTSMTYELAMIKLVAEPALFSVSRQDPAYPKIAELLKVLDFILGGGTEVIPRYSILREFIGNSSLKVG